MKTNLRAECCACAKVAAPCVCAIRFLHLPATSPKATQTPAHSAGRRISSRQETAIPTEASRDSMFFPSRPNNFWNHRSSRESYRCEAGSSKMTDKPRVVIVCAGFGGLNPAQKLAKAPVQIIVIDRKNFHTFQPLLYQV